MHIIIKHNTRTINCFSALDGKFTVFNGPFHFIGLRLIQSSSRNVWNLSVCLFVNHRRAEEFFKTCYSLQLIVDGSRSRSAAASCCIQVQIAGGGSVAVAVGVAVGFISFGATIRTHPKNGWSAVCRMLFFFFNLIVHPLAPTLHST